MGSVLQHPLYTKETCRNHGRVRPTAFLTVPYIVVAALRLFSAVIWLTVPYIVVAALRLFAGVAFLTVAYIVVAALRLFVVALRLFAGASLLR